MIRLPANKYAKLPEEFRGKRTAFANGVVAIDLKGIIIKNDDGVQNLENAYFVQQETGIAQTYDDVIQKMKQQIQQVFHQKEVEQKRYATVQTTRNLKNKSVVHQTDGLEKFENKDFDSLFEHIAQMTASEVDIWYHRKTPKKKPSVRKRVSTPLYEKNKPGDESANLDIRFYRNGKKLHKKSDLGNAKTIFHNSTLKQTLQNINDDPHHDAEDQKDSDEDLVKDSEVEDEDIEEDGEGEEEDGEDGEDENAEDDGDDVEQEEDDAEEDAEKDPDEIESNDDSIHDSADEKNEFEEEDVEEDIRDESEGEDYDQNMEDFALGVAESDDIANDNDFDIYSGLDAIASPSHDAFDDF